MLLFNWRTRALGADLSDLRAVRESINAKHNKGLNLLAATEFHDRTAALDSAIDAVLGSLPRNRRSIRNCSGGFIGYWLPDLRRGLRTIAWIEAEIERWLERTRQMQTSDVARKNRQNLAVRAVGCLVLPQGRNTRRSLVPMSGCRKMPIFCVGKLRKIL